MFWNKKPDPNPLGIPLGDLVAMLAPTSIEATLAENAVIARHAQFTVRLEVVAPDDRESENGPIQAVVRVISDLPGPFLSMLNRDLAMGASVFNKCSALGAIYALEGSPRLGSRLTIYEAEDAWRTLHLPMLLYTTIGGTEALLGAVRRTLTGQPPRAGASVWTEADLTQVEAVLSRICVCTTGGLGLTAEFGLADGQLTAMAGHGKTALLRLIADEPHPEFGGGLFCLLEMPHGVGDESRLHNICLQLNNMEMAAHDLPPHFGAWCPGRQGDNPAYVSFLPNALHAASGIAVNWAIWAFHRAQWANGMLVSMGVRA